MSDETSNVIDINSRKVCGKQLHHAFGTYVCCLRAGHPEIGHRAKGGPFFDTLAEDAKKKVTK